MSGCEVESAARCGAIALWGALPWREAEENGEGQLCHAGEERLCVHGWREKGEVAVTSG